jgi:cytochrome P450
MAEADRCALAPVSPCLEALSIMTETASVSGLYYDPCDFAIDDDPYPVWKRLRDEAPLYHNEKYDFYALSRYDDVEPALQDWDTYHPGQRRQVAADRSMLPRTVEEALRYEAPSPVQCRYVAREVSCHGQAVPVGSVMLLLNGSANRDERHFPDADRFDINRDVRHHFSFGHGLHFCLGAALARLEARVALDEVLSRWPDWQVDYANAVRAHTSSVRGWAKLPATTG